MTLRAKIQKALDRVGEHTLDDVAQRIAEQRAFPFIKGESVIIAELYPYLHHSEVNCWIGAGRLDEIMATLPDVEEWGRFLGAKYIRGAGRLGWQRILAQHGYHKRDIVMYKEL